MAHFLVLGAGRMGTVLAKDLIESGEDNTVTLVNDGARALHIAKRFIASRRLILLKNDMENGSERSHVMKGRDVVFSALLHEQSLPSLETAVRQGVPYVDLVGESPLERLELDSEAKKNGVTAISGVGLSPGITNACVAQAVRLLDETDNARIFVGGVPLHPAPPLNHRIVYSFSSFLNFYEKNAQLLKNGRELELPPLSGVEPISFPPDFPDMECFYTRGLSSLVLFMKGKIQGELSKKTVRHRGHIQGIKALMECGLFSTQAVPFGSKEIVPRNLLEAVLEPKLRLGEDTDVTLLRIIVTGRKSGKSQTHVFEMIDRFDPGKKYTSMAKTTAFPASIVGQMIVSGKIAKKGILFPEQVLAGGLFPAFKKGLAERGVFLSHTVLEN